jgi:DNA gyrase subunit B
VTIQAEILIGASPDALTARVTITTHGIEVVNDFERDFFVSSEYRRLIELANRFEAMLPGDARLVSGDREQPVRSLRQAVEQALGDAQRGVSIQRYKGLGEMNPEQLWETTMDPAVRNLLHVRIEDAVAADEIFSTLMGDQVEPRRDFIETHALAVTNLDT